MMVSYPVFIILAVLVRNSSPSMIGKSEFEAKMFESGKEQFEMAKQRSSLPRQGECWKVAISRLSTGCDHLDENQHTMLSLSLADCFLEMSGEEKHKCGDLDGSSERAACIKKMPDRAFGVFTKFFTHVSNMCYFLKSSVWHEMAENTIDSLLTVSQQVDSQMKDVREANNRLLAFQQKSISLQEQVINNGASLDEVIKKSASSVALLMTELRENTMDQQLALLDISQRLSALQAWAVGEVSWLESLAYFAIAVCTAYLTTAWSRAHEARGWIFVLLFIGVLLEQAIFKFVLANLEGASSMFQKESIYFWVWKLRYLMLAMCVSVYIYCVSTFVDYSQVNNKLLTSIHNMVRDLQNTGMALELERPMNQVGPELEENRRNRRETSVTVVRVEQKTFNKKSPTPIRTSKRTMAILEVDDSYSPNTPRYNLRNTPLRNSNTPVRQLTIKERNN
ncbi:uncharacterized protein LOC132193066 [Neocloeon triangulifer]|uniref:uncharacterized protein LOC132193066 n=1 Tax=Neocloeon triangulifer TaxID=2078957 RepID=UPI00286F64BE|nr:uncharacterized protein LOC132193066 [Neocloeon triangulifer]